jgi:hypothetical protein
VTSPQPYQQFPYEQQKSSPAEEAVVAALVAYFASKAAIHAVLLPKKLTDAMEAVGIAPMAARAAGKLALSVPLTGRSRHGAPGSPSPGSWVGPSSVDTPTMARRVAADEPRMRARFTVNSAQRLTQRLLDGTFTQGLEQENTYLVQHVMAGRNRRQAAKSLDTVADRAGSGFLKWVAKMDSNTTPDCEKLNGTVFSIEDPPALPGAVHPQCVPSGTVVSGPGVLAGTVRWYDGNMVEVRTALGHVLSVTPNHPILTSEGWVAAGSIIEGAQVVCDISLETMAASDPYDYQRPALVENVARALYSSSRMTTTTVPVSSMDFHGDGSDGYVNVVRTNGFLQNRIQVRQPFGDQHFARTGGRSTSLDGSCDPRAMFDALALASNGFIRGGGVGSTLLRRATGSQQTVGLEHRASSNTVVMEPASQQVSRGAELLSKTLSAFSGLVALNQVTGITRYPFSGHVFNLETSGGWYTANGLIIHNCRCKAIAVPIEDIPSTTFWQAVSI